MDRASLDIDFSIDGDFSESEVERLKMSFYGLLNSEFEKHNLIVFDIEFREKPKNNQVKEWKGYVLTFKIVEYSKYDPDDMGRTRNAAFKIYDNQSTKFNVEISSYEYTKPKKMVDIDGAVFYVYTPEMIVFEKIRALCQSMPEYSQIIPTAKVKGRARDFYDIWNLCDKYLIDFESDTNKKMFVEIFNAKRVPLNFIDYFLKYKDLQKEDWNNVVDTLLEDDTRGFYFYFDYVVDKLKHFKNL